MTVPSQARIPLGLDDRQALALDGLVREILTKLSMTELSEDKEPPQ
jgi:hypothetical protein